MAVDLLNPSDQTILNGATNLVLNLIATDPNNDPLTYNASVQSLESYWDQKLGLAPTQLNNYFNWGGLREKWFSGTSYPWYYMTPNGNLYAWLGGALSKDPLVAQLSVDVYNNPVMLLSAVNNSPATVSLVGNVLTIDPNDGFVGKFVVVANASDSFGGSDSEAFFVTVSARPPDSTSPTITNRIPAPSAALTSPTVNIDVTFSETVIGVHSTDLVLTGSATAGTIQGPAVNLGGNTWRFPISNLVNGTAIVQLAPDSNDIEDISGNDLAPSTWSYTVDLSIVQLPPTLNMIADRTLSSGYLNAIVNLVAMDPNNDPLTFSASPQSLEYYLDQTLNLSFSGNEFLNWGGLNEKWMLGKGGWYYVLPSGKLYRWSGGDASHATFIDQLSPASYEYTSLLYNATANSAQASLSVVGNVLTVNPADSFTGRIHVSASVSDGLGGTDSKSFFVNVGTGFTSLSIPTVIAQTPALGATITSPTIFVDIAFSEPVTRVDATDLVLSGSAAAIALPGLPIAVDALTWRFSVHNLVSGQLNITLAPDEHDIQDHDGMNLGSVSWNYIVSLA
ncbi:MAG: Ig-like domain-containing protein [Pirellula sp.]